MMNYNCPSSYFHYYPTSGCSSFSSSFSSASASPHQLQQHSPTDHYPITKIRNSGDGGGSGGAFQPTNYFPSHTTIVSNNNNNNTSSSSGSASNSTSNINPNMFSSVEFWSSFVQKYEEYRKCLKSLSSGDVVLSKTAEAATTHHHQQQSPPTTTAAASAAAAMAVATLPAISSNNNNNNNSANLSSISAPNMSINSSIGSSSSGGNGSPSSLNRNHYYHPYHHPQPHSHPHPHPHHQQQQQMTTPSTTINPAMFSYSPKPTASSSPLTSNSNSSSPLLNSSCHKQQQQTQQQQSCECLHACSNCSNLRRNTCHKTNETVKYASPNYRLPFDDSFSTSSTDAMTFKDRQKRFNRFVKKRFIDEFGPIEYLSYKMLKRHESSMMDRIKHEARERYLPNDVTEIEFKVYWKSALNTIRQTRYRYRSRQQYRY